MGARSLLLFVWVAAALTAYLCDLECLMGGLDCHAETSIACTAPVCHLDDTLPVAVALLPPPPPSAPAPLIADFLWTQPAPALLLPAWSPPSQSRAPPTA